MFGMYISDITARESIKKPQEGLWIQMPAFRRDDGTYKKIIEFPNNNDIFKHIEKICRKAVEDYIDSTQQLSVDDFIIDELAPQDEYEKGLDDVSKK